MNSEEPEVSRNVIEMITVANEYCLFMESIDKYSKDDTIFYLQKLLPLLYIKGCTLPIVDVQFPEANERFVTEENWQTVFNDARNIFGKNDEQWIVNHYEQDEESRIKISLSEFLADIYQDMKDFILLYQKNTKYARENAVFELKELFASHWGFRLLEVHKFMHLWIFRNNIEF